MHFQIQVFISVILTLPQQLSMTHSLKSFLFMSHWALQQPLCLKQAAVAPFFDGRLPQTDRRCAHRYTIDMTSL